MISPDTLHELRVSLFQIWEIYTIITLLILCYLTYTNKITHRKSFRIGVIGIAFAPSILPAFFLPISAFPVLPSWSALPIWGLLTALALKLNSGKDKRTEQDESNGITAILEKYREIQKAEWRKKSDDEKSEWLMMYEKGKPKPLPVYLIIICTIISFAFGALVMYSPCYL